MWIYQQTATGFAVGYSFRDELIVTTTHESESEAANRVHYLNGGSANAVIELTDVVHDIMETQFARSRKVSP